MPTFSELMSFESGPAARFEVPDGWQQGRGAFGGLVVGALIRAAEHQEPEKDRLVRSVTSEIPGAVLAGPAVLQAEVLRRGNGVTAVRVALEQDGEKRAHAVVVLAKDRAASPKFTPEPPALGAYTDVEALPADMPGAPTFTQHLEYRTRGAVPYSSAPSPLTEGWIRLRSPGPERGAAYLAALTDAWWSPGAVVLDEFRPMATLSFTLDVLAGLDGLDPDAPLFQRARATAGGGGYLVEDRELWGHDGRLVALNRQLVTYIR
ncbi:MAG: thioesterase family protein [Myxococcaceae bacterium]|nr:thioesterase family protein [Myxococcaceae bacterium]